MSPKINLLAEGLNKLRVGDKVRVREGEVYEITSTTEDAIFNGKPQPISSSGINWCVNGQYYGRSRKSRFDIIGIIRPGRVEFP